MNGSGWRSHLRALRTALITCLGLLSLSTAPAWATAGTVTEFPLPQQGTPFDITAGPDGNLWFADAGGNKIGRLTTAGAITEFRIKTKSSFPVGITAGPDGNLWFTESQGNNIGRITPAGNITEFRLLSSCGKYLTCSPHGITTGLDGNLWFTMENADAIGRISPSGSFGSFGIPTASPVAEGITAGADGNVWFTEERASKIGRVTTS
jgi:virginiamycin B lyase